MKKIISAILAIMMLGQTAFAASLKDFVDMNFPTAITDGKFDWSTFSGNVIQTKATTTVRVHNEGTYADHSSVVLNSGNAAKTAFDYKADLDMSNVRIAFDSLYDLTIAALQHDATLETQFKDSEVRGEFIVEVAYDTGLSLDPATVFVLKQNNAPTPNFTLTSSNTSANPATFTFNMTPVTVDSLRANKNDWLADLSMEIANVTAAPGANRSLTVSMTSAYTILNDKTGTPAVDYAKITFSTPTPAPATASAIVFVPAASTGSSGSSVTPPKAYTVVEDVKDSVTVKKESGKYYVNVDELEKPIKEGYVFDGWYLDIGYTNPVNGTIQIKRNTNLYGRFLPIEEEVPNAFTVVEGSVTQIPVTSEDGIYTVDIGSLPIPDKTGFVFNGWFLDPYYSEQATGTISIDQNTYIYAEFINTVAPSKLISDDHIIYIVGYPDGEVKPNGLITREEVAAAFYRLLDPAYRATIETTEHQFSDVAPTRWSNEEIATLANGGFIVGDENGNFNPSRPITRAEFVTIAVKFADMSEVPETNIFTDITGHWAEEFILRATNEQHWISGYEDHTFRPNNNITRAEAMTIINKMLVRYGDIDADVLQWPDVDKNDWFYTNVMEATRDHDYDRHEDGWNENWTVEAVTE